MRDSCPFSFHSAKTTQRLDEKWRLSEIQKQAFATKIYVSDFAATLQKRFERTFQLLPPNPRIRSQENYHSVEEEAQAELE